MRQRSPMRLFGERRGGNNSSQPVRVDKYSRVLSQSDSFSARDAADANREGSVVDGRGTVKSVYSIATDQAAAQHNSTAEPPGLDDPKDEAQTASVKDDDGPMTPLDTNLNDSRETQSTPIISNAREQARMMAQKSKRASLPSNAKPPAAGKPPMPPPRQAAGSSPQRRKERGATSEMSPSKDSQRTESTMPKTLDDDSVSTLGSLVTKGSEDVKSGRKTRPPVSSDLSTVTELSEIERLRKENVKLREELENASQLSSRVSTMYAKSLKLENNRLREEIENTSQLQEDDHLDQEAMMYKSTLQALLEKGNEKRRPRRNNRRRPAASAANARDREAITDFNHLPPVAHLINGVDFDDDTITNYSSLADEDDAARHLRRDGCADMRSPEFIRKTCSRMKSLAQDVNNERRESCNVPLRCFTACARKDRRDGVKKTTTTTEGSRTRKSKGRKQVSDSLQV